jgi:transposase
MSMGCRKDVQGELLICPAELPDGSGHVFYEKLNQVLGQYDFDRQVESICERLYAAPERGGRPSLPPGVYFRMCFNGYFEGITSYRGIAWRCSDSLTLRKFLGILLTQNTPDHSTLSYLRQRLTQDVHEQVMGIILDIARKEKLLKGEQLIVDSTLIEANAAMETIKHKETGEIYQQYLKKLSEQDGLVDPKANELRSFDQKRPDKSCSNDDWESPSDPEARITKMKDKTTHLAYKVEHAVGVESGLIVASPVYQATEHDSTTLVKTLEDAQINLVRGGSETDIQEVVADKGYFAIDTMEECEELDVRTYLSEKKPSGGRRTFKWVDKDLEQEARFRKNRKNVRSDKGKSLMKRRGELVKRSFAHVCETGGGRRSYLRGKEKVQKRHLLLSMAFNLGVVMRKLFKMGKPRCLQGKAACLVHVVLLWWRLTVSRVQTFRTVLCPIPSAASNVGSSTDSYPTFFKADQLPVVARVE